VVVVVVVVVLVVVVVVDLFISLVIQLSFCQLQLYIYKINCLQQNKFVCLIHFMHSCMVYGKLLL
jgi:hypothetical protein